MYKITLRTQYNARERALAEKAIRALNAQICDITDAYKEPSSTKVATFREISARHRLSTVVSHSHVEFTVAAIDDLPVIRDFVMHTTMWYITKCNDYKFDVDIELV